MTYLALKEDSSNNNGLYRGSKSFRVGEFRDEMISINILYGWRD